MDHGWEITCSCGHRGPASTFYPDNKNAVIICPVCGRSATPPATLTPEDVTHMPDEQWHTWYPGSRPALPGYYELKYRDDSTEIIHVRPFFEDMANYEPEELMVDLKDEAELVDVTDAMFYLVQWRGPIPEIEALNPA